MVCNGLDDVAAHPSSFNSCGAGLLGECYGSGEVKWFVGTFERRHVE
jgi:hypothetical protein